jgi:hypothetical protein
MNDHVANIRALLREAVPAVSSPAPRTHLRLQPSTFDAITRDSHLHRIRYLARAYRLRWLVDQATFDRPGLDSLEDVELVQLHQDMDRAMDCIRDGISFDEAGLLRPKG